MQILCLCFVKLSFVFFYRRIFCVGDKLQPFNVVTAVVNMIVISWTIGFFFACLFACKGNFAAWWTTQATFTSECVKTVKLEYAFAVSDFLIDVLVISLPIPMVRNLFELVDITSKKTRTDREYQVWGLQMSLGRRLGVIAVFSLGMV